MTGARQVQVVELVLAHHELNAMEWRLGVANA